MMSSLLYKTGTLSMRRRSALALTGAAVIGVSALPQHAAAQAQEWYDRNFQADVFGIDDAVDIAYWKEDASNEWVFVTGYHTTPDGATVFATSKYLATFTGPGENNAVKTVFYPPIATATGTNRAVAIEVDFEGNVYVTGESTDPNGVDGQDFLIIKYNSDLQQHSDWIDPPQHIESVRRWNNEAFDGDDRPVGMSLGIETLGPVEPNVIGITGTTFVGAFTGRDDIATVQFSTDTGTLLGGFGTNGAAIRAGSALDNDRPVDLEMYWTAEPDNPGQVVLRTVVAGTLRQVNNAQINDDVWTTEYDASGTALWEAIYNGPMNGDDTASAGGVAR